jgi:hypothetical protein
MPPSQDRAAMVRQALAMIEDEKRTQPQRLAEARSRVEDERIKAVAAEPWSDVVSGTPTNDLVTGEVNGMFAMPTVEGKELFGTRLAFDLLGCCGDDEQVAAKLHAFRKMIRDDAHLVVVFAAALDTIASDVVPALLDTYEQKSGDYEARVRLARVARHAWAARVADLRGDKVAEE